MAAQPGFSIDGVGWKMSFQRRVGKANRGAIPYLAVETPPEALQVLVPLRGGEALWIAVLTDDLHIIVEGYAGDRPRRVEKLPAGSHQNLHMINAVLDKNLWIPIDTNAITAADNRDTIGDGLAVVISHPVDATAQRIAIFAATPELYSALGGLPAPEPTTERDEYGGWRLP
jgi:hypothetical protein